MASGGAPEEVSETMLEPSWDMLELSRCTMWELSCCAKLELSWAMSELVLSKLGHVGAKLGQVGAKLGFVAAGAVAGSPSEQQDA